MVFSNLLNVGQSVAADGTKPNVILILADDLAIGDLASQNGGVTRTPNLDRLRRQSVRFTNAYSASCVCAPARAALLTGRYPHRTGVVTLNMNRYPSLTRLRRDETTIARVLSERGWKTGLIGKWHCGVGRGFHPNDRGFQEFQGFSGSQDLSFFKYTLDIDGKIHEVTDGYLTDDLSKRAIEFVRRHKNEPFFLHLAHYAPHRPIEAPQEKVQYYVDQGIEETTATIYAMIEIMDRGIGQLLDELDRLKLAEKTLIIFASDNGPDPLTGNRFNNNLRGMKYEIYEGGIRVPLFIRKTDSFAPGNRNELVHFVDLLPTILDHCDVQWQPSNPIDGMSFHALLSGDSYSGDSDSGDSATQDDERYWQWNRGTPNYTHNAAVRQGEWKLVRPYVNRKSNPPDSTANPVLYHLASDPKETKDVAGRHPKKYAELLGKLNQWSKSVEQERRRP